MNIQLNTSSEIKSPKTTTDIKATVPESELRRTTTDIKASYFAESTTESVAQKISLSDLFRKVLARAGFSNARNVEFGKSTTTEMALAA